MDQLKIGKFIAEMRKGQSYTQRQLADILGISVRQSANGKREMGFRKFP